MAAAESQLVPGVGDEVLLFGGFLLASLVLIVFVSRRNQGRRQQGADDHTAEQVQVEESPRGDSETSPATEQDTHPRVPAASAATTEGDAVLREESESGLRSRFHSAAEDSSANNERERELHQRESASGESSGTQDGDTISIRLVLPQNTMTVHVIPTTTLDRIRRTYFQEELSQNRPVRFIYRGRVLHEDTETLEQLSIGHNTAVHVHVGSPRPPGTGDLPEHQPEEMDISRLFVPLFGVILALCWVALLSYPHFFSLMTKLFLFALSVGYVVLAYVSNYG